MPVFPSKDQQKIIDHRGRPLVVVAGPGTGKTATVVERMIKILLEDPSRVVSFLTFTRASRADTEEKLKKAVGKQSASDSPLDLPRASTLHTFAKSLVHRYAATVGLQDDFSVLNEPMGETDLIVSEVIEDLASTLETDELKHALSYYHSMGVWPADLRLSASERKQALESFSALIGFYNATDMEGIVWKACEVLARGTSALPPVYLQVDEYQDLNPIDQQLVRLASGSESSEVVVVGDDAQSIYGFRYANPDGLRELWTSDEWAQVSLDSSYRLPSHILRAAHALVKDRGYLGAGIDVPPDDGKLVLTLRCTKSFLQAEAIGKHIDYLFANSKKVSGEVLAYSDFMVLCPNKVQVGQIAEGLTETGIPVNTASEQAMSESTWTFLLLLRMLSKRDGLALRQWLQRVGLDESQIRTLRRQAQERRQSLYDWCESSENASIQRFFNALERLRKSQMDPSEFRDALVAVPGFLPDDDLWKLVDDSLSNLPFFAQMITHIQGAHGIQEEAPSHAEADPTENSVLVATMHSSKGLEAEFVFLAWMNEGFMPTPGRDILEEERVFYVALTRAKQDVVMLCFERYDKKRGYLKGEAMSPFLKAIEGHLDIKRVMAKDLH